MICEFSNKGLTFKDLIEKKWNYDSKIWKIYADEVLELVEEIKENSKIEVNL